MKPPILSSILVAGSLAVSNAADLSVFRVCQDQRVIHTSDGAEAGHIQYIVVDPASREIVSTVVSGGEEGERLIAIPYASLTFTSEREIALRDITRERLVSAPVIERTAISSSVIESTIIERTRTHFAGRTDETIQRTEGVNGSTTTRDRSVPDARSNAEQNVPGGAAVRSQTEVNPNGARDGNRSPQATTNGTQNGTENQPQRGETGARGQSPAKAENGAVPKERSDTPPATAPERKPETKGSAERQNATPATKEQNAERQGTNEQKKTPANQRAEENNPPAGTTDKTADENAAGNGNSPKARKQGANDHEKAAEAAGAEKATVNGASPKAKKQAEEDATATATKHQPKSKTQSPTDEKRNEEQRPPQP
jgi:hypothetical protein